MTKSRISYNQDGTILGGSSKRRDEGVADISSRHRIIPEQSIRLIT
jgi:hypothetical protein